MIVAFTTYSIGTKPWTFYIVTTLAWTGRAGESGYTVEFLLPHKTDTQWNSHYSRRWLHNGNLTALEDGYTMEFSLK